MAKDKLSKADRKKLEKKEAKVMAELERRAHPKKKGKGGDVMEPMAPDLGSLKPKALKALIKDKTNGKPLRQAAKAELARRDSETLAPPAKAEKVKPDPKDDEPVKPSPKAKTTKAADKVLADPEASEGAKVAAETAKEAAAEASDDETDADIKARVAAKRAAREAAAVKGADGKPVAPDVAGSARKDDALPGESEVEYQTRKAVERDAAEKPKSKSKAADKALAEGEFTHEGDAAATPDEVVEVETERGRVFAAGAGEDAPAEVEFAKPSEAPRSDYEVNGNGQYKVRRPSDGKVVGYTRVTTFIGTNEDRSLLEKWKLRILLEGVAINDSPDEKGRIDDPVMGKVRDLIHRRDVAIAKARKADRKGKLVPGQYGTIVDAAWAEFKRDLDDLAEHLLELGGAHEKAAKGTQLHELTELYDREGIDAVGALAVEGTITYADLADVEAYARAIKAAGITILPEYIECPVVIHDEKIAGRLDRVVMARLPGAARAARYVLDTKSGRIDLGAGKIAQQLEKYAKATPYDLDKMVDLEPHKASATKGLVLHLVPGSGEAHIYVVDLSTGRVGNRLSAEVRAFRNDGKRAIDMTTDLAAGGAS